LTTSQFSKSTISGRTRHEKAEPFLTLPLAL
jgi:hypothetical protein